MGSLTSARQQLLAQVASSYIIYWTRCTRVRTHLIQSLRYNVGLYSLRTEGAALVSAAQGSIMKNKRNLSAAIIELSAAALATAYPRACLFKFATNSHVMQVASSQPFKQNIAIFKLDQGNSARAGGQPSQTDAITVLIWLPAVTRISHYSVRISIIHYRC